MGHTAADPGTKPAVPTAAGPGNWESAKWPGCGQIAVAGPEWLTTDEWNVCYFLGLQAYHRDGVECGVCAQVVVGMELLHAADYRFEHLSSGTAGAFEPIPGARAPRNHEQTCKELGEGAFDSIDRVRRVLPWLSDRAPGLDRAWLEDLLRRYLHLHTG